MDCRQEQDSRANRYRTKCPGPLSLSSTQRFQPYHRPMSSMRFSPESITPPYYVPTPPCPAPGTWANTFSYDDYSTKVWANDVYHQQRMYLHLQTALLQRDILMAESAAYSQYSSCAYAPMVSTPRTPNIPDNIAISIMKEESDAGYLSMISRVSPDGDINDDVLDPGNCSPETPNDIPADTRDSVYDTSVPSVNSPVVYQIPRVPFIPSPLTTPSMLPAKPEPVTPTAEPVATPTQTLQSSAMVKEEPKPKPSKKPKKSNAEPSKYECNVCGKVFGWRTGFVTHLRVHSGERPYMCPDCPKSFSDYSTYAKHCRIHSGVKPYSCDICGKAFTQSGNRLRHMRTVHKAKQ